MFSRSAVIETSWALAISLLAPASAAPDKPLNAERSVTLKETNVPLRVIAERLSSSDLQLTVAPELRESKAIVLVRRKPLGEVMARLADLYGAEWTPAEQGAGGGFTLRRTPEVARWLAFWKASRATAARHARQVRAARTRIYMDQLIREAFATPTLTEDPNAAAPGGIASVALTRFLGTFPPRDLDAIALAVAAGSELHSGGEFNEPPSPVTYRFRDMTEAQQKALRAYTQEAGITRALTQIQDARVSFRILGNIKFDLQFPDGTRGGDWVISMKVGAPEMEKVFHEALLHLLSSRRTPDGALLGAAFRSEKVIDAVSQVERSAGVALPLVRVTGKSREVELPGIPARGLLYSEFLSHIADRAELDVVADYHTLSHRVIVGREIPARERHSLEELLQSVAPTYQQVFRQEGDFLLARSCFWPDREEEEAPHPLPDTWLESKRKNGSLTLKEILALAAIPVPQQNGLAAYDDQGLSLRREVEYIRGNRRLVTVLASLSDEQLAKTELENGLSIRELNPQLQALLRAEFLERGVGMSPALTVPEEWQRVVLRQVKPAGGSKSGGSALFALLPGSPPFWLSSLPSGSGFRAR